MATLEREDDCPTTGPSRSAQDRRSRNGPPFDLIESKLRRPWVRPGIVSRTALVDRLLASRGAGGLGRRSGGLRQDDTACPVGRAHRTTGSPGSRWTSGTTTPDPAVDVPRRRWTGWRRSTRSCSGRAGFAAGDAAYRRHPPGGCNVGDDRTGRAGPGPRRAGLQPECLRRGGRARAASPAGSQLAIATRDAPPLPMARLRVAGRRGGDRRRRPRHGRVRGAGAAGGRRGCVSPMLTRAS